MASLAGFKRRPEAFYAWLRPLAERIAGSEPNPAHLALAALERVGRLQAVITQNIDGLHQQAGSQRVLELHGHLREATCLNCGGRTSTADLLPPYLASGVLPLCPGCGGVLKPDVVLFGELLPADVMQQAEAEADACDLFWVVGSSLSVVPASLLPQRALQRGARLIIANGEPTLLDGAAEVVLRGDVAQVLPALAELCIP